MKTVKNVIAGENLWLVIFWSITLFVFSPFVMYVTNVDELWFTMSSFMPTLCALAMCLIVVCGICIAFMPRQITSVVSVILFALGVCTYIQGQIMRNDYGELDGATIAWGQYTKTAIINTIVWLAIVAVVLFLYLKFNKRFLESVKILSIIFIAYEFLLCGMLFGQNFEKINEKTASEEWHLTDEGLFDMSSKRNVIVFVLDCYDTTTFMEMEEKYPEVKEIFDGFTYYPDTVCTTSKTVYAVPYFLTGQLYTDKVSEKEFYVNSYTKSPLLRHIDKNNVGATIWADDHCVSPAGNHNITNYKITSGKVSSYVLLTKDMLKLSCFRSFPHILKKYMWLYSGDFDKYKQNDKYGLYNADNVAFYDRLLNEKLDTNSDETCFKYIHLHGNHQAYAEDETGYKGETDRIRQARGCMVYVEEYLTQLKKLGIYDDSYVVVMADHGRREKDHIEDENSSVEVSKNFVNTEANPIFFVKPFNSNGDMKVVQSPIYLSCFQNMLIDAIDGKGTMPDDLCTGAEERLVYKGLNTSSGVEEYIIKGVVYDNPEIVATGRVFNGNLLAEGADYTKYKFGTVISFANNDEGRKYILSGVAEASDEFTWLVSGESKFGFDIKNKYDNVRVYMLAYAKDGLQNIKILANGNEVYSEAFKGGEIQFDIPKEYFPDGKLELTVEHNDSIHDSIALVSLYINPVIEY